MFRSQPIYLYCVWLWHFNRFSWLLFGLVMNEEIKKKEQQLNRKLIFRAFEQTEMHGLRRISVWRPYWTATKYFDMILRICVEAEGSIFPPYVLCFENMSCSLRLWPCSCSAIGHVPIGPSHLPSQNYSIHRPENAIQHNTIVDI